jgi:crotonobetainyl-CoA:carnitine CoA-transferase CaiB-like acyl-CoA transferase
LTDGGASAGDPALKGLKVVELAETVAGEFEGWLLAELGADVLKIERPGGSPTRAVGPFARARPDPNTSLNFWYYNCSKRSAVLDYADPARRGELDAILADADVLISTFQPREAAELGLSLQALARRFPRLIIVSISAFGLTGPWVDYKSSELVAMALGGPLFSCGYDDHSIPPINPGGPQASHCATSFAHIGVMLALIERQTSGLGQIVDVSQHDATAMNIENANPYWFYPRAPVQRQTCRHAQPKATQPSHFLCADGGYVYFTLVLSEQKAWKALVSWMDSKGLAANLTDPAFLQLDERQKHYADIHGVVECFFLLIDSQDACREGQTVGLPIGVINAPEDLFEDPHLSARGFFQSVDHDAGGTARYPGPIYRFTAFETEHRRPAPDLGADQAALASPWS